MVFLLMREQYKLMKPARTWVTTDWHLFHQKLVESGERPPDFQDRMLKNHRQLIKPQDTLVNLGDVCFYQMPALAAILASIPGRHLLTLGNHDHKSRGWYERSGFVFAADMFVLGNVAFSHKPLNSLSDGCEFNVHGHLHLHRGYKEKQPWHRLLAMEQTDYKPVLLETICL